MNKKGFTMIELLAVIIILATLLGVTTVSVFSIRKNQEKQNRENTISSILTGAKTYTAEHPSQKYNGNEINIQDLIDGEYIDFDKGDKNINDLLTKKIVITSCSNPMKVKFVLSGYNDCGCESQVTTGDAVSNKICSE